MLWALEGGELGKAFQNELHAEAVAIALFLFHLNSRIRVGDSK